MDSNVKINLNRCSTEQLNSFIPRLSFDLAHKIVAYRRRKGVFQSVENLLDIRGVDNHFYSQLKNRVFVGPECGKGICEDIISSQESQKNIVGKKAGNSKSKRRQTVAGDVLKTNTLQLQKSSASPCILSQQLRTSNCLTLSDGNRDGADGLFIFLRGDVKEYINELDGIQITVTPKRLNKAKPVSQDSESSETNLADVPGKAGKVRVEKRPTRESSHPRRSREHNANVKDNEEEYFRALTLEKSPNISGSSAHYRSFSSEKTVPHEPDDVHVASVSSEDSIGDYSTPWKSDTFTTQPIHARKNDNLNDHKETQTDTFDCDKSVDHQLQPRSDDCEIRPNEDDSRMASHGTEKQNDVRRWLSDISGTYITRAHDEEETDKPLDGITEVERLRVSTPVITTVPVSSERPLTSTPISAERSTPVTDEYRTPMRHRAPNEETPEANTTGSKTKSRSVPRCMRHGQHKHCSCDRKRRHRHRDRAHRGLDYGTEGGSGILQCSIL